LTNTQNTEDRQLIAEIQNSAASYISTMRNFLNAWTTREALAGQRNEVGNKVMEQAQQLSMIVVSETDAIAANSISILNASSIMIISGLIIAVVMAFILAYFITQSITTGVKQGVWFAQNIAAGDLPNR
jgi:methyl-accepting chemotaxis protein